MKVLIVEDDPISREIVAGITEDLGHDFLTAEDGQEGWEIFQASPDVEVIISDWMMPRIDGLELCRRVRSTDRPGYTFFIFVTALGAKEHLLEGMQAGADEYLTKPVDVDQLEAKLITASRIVSLHRHLEGGTDREESTGTTLAAESEKTRPPARRRTRIGGGKFWDILISQGKISEEQVQRALEAQKGRPSELGKVMVSLGFISEADLAQAQAQRLNLDYVELTEADVDREAVNLVPEKLLRRHGVLPLYREDGRLFVAMSDPTNILALDDLRMSCGYRIVPVVTTEGSLQQMQTRVFSTSDQVAEILQEAAEMEPKDHGELELGAQVDANEAPVVQLVNSILQRAVGEEASDIHMEPQPQELKVRLRIDGVLRELMSVPPKLQAGIVARVKILANLDIAERRIPQDGRFSVRLVSKKVDLRVATLPTIFGEEMVLRLLDTSNLGTDLTELGFAPRDFERYRAVFERPYGTILVAGPTGSGKSTTLYATLNRLNSPGKKIITIEDPVEYRMGGINQIQVNPKVGLTFASGLRSILRNDPDVVMVGEIRDPETAKTAVEAALTGHLVLATLHTNDAPSAVTRLTEMGVEPFLTATAVDCVIAQRLARRLCEDCKRPTEMDEEVLSGLNFPFKHAREGEPRFYEAVGCAKCNGSGYRGRIGLYELMVVSDDIREIILRRASITEIERAAEDDGMMRLRDDGLLKAARGVTAIEEILRVVV